MLTLITCPTCHHKFTVPEGSMGQRRTCPNCEAIFVAGKSVAESNGPVGTEPRRGLLERAAEESQASKMPLDKTMLAETPQTIKYNCPRCKKPLESPVSEAGTKKPCPHCSGRLQVPAKPAAAPGVDPLNKTMLGEAETIPAAKPQAIPATPQAAPAVQTALVPEQNPWKKYAIGGGVGLLLLIVVLQFLGKQSLDSEHAKLLHDQKTELEKLRADIEQKTALLLQQRDMDAKQRKDWDDLKAKQDARQKEWDQERALELKRLASLNDEKQAADAKARLEAKQREREEEIRAADERRLKTERETRERLETLQRQLDNANQRNTTIIQQPPPAPAYPWWYYHRYYPW